MNANFWGSYYAFDPAYDLPPSELTRSQAKELFSPKMQQIPERIEVLSELYGAPLGRTMEDIDIHELNGWFVDHVSADPDQEERLLPRWYGVCTDIGLLLGEVMTHRAPHLAWELSTASRRLYDHHWPVIRGFRRAAKNYAVGPELRVAGQGYSVILGTSDRRDIFLKTVETVENYA